MNTSDKNQALHKVTTFADVEVHGLFRVDEKTWEKRTPWRSSCGFEENATECMSGSLDSARFGDSQPVTLLAVTPVEPARDPAVMTYAALDEKGGSSRFRWLNPKLDEGVCILNARGWSNDDGDLCRTLTHTRETELVRVLTSLEVAQNACPEGASVVVHEEPKGWLRLDPEGRKGEQWRLSDFDCWLTRSEVESVVREGAAILNQHDTHNQPSPAATRDLFSGRASRAEQSHES